MSTVHGSAKIAFRGFPPISVRTVEGEIVFHNYWGESFHPKRKVVFADGSKRRLSKKERSCLLTLSRKWGKRHPHRTLCKVSY